MAQEYTAKGLQGDILESWQGSTLAGTGPLSTHAIQQ